MAASEGPKAAFNFCHNPHARSLLQGLQELRSDNKLIDVILCVSGKEIPCHRNVLAACSEYFRAMFCNGHLESIERKVTIREVSTDILRLLVDYAYSSRITITKDNAMKILEGANFFQIKPVYDACVKFISNNLSAKNCLQIVHISNMLSCSDLEKKAQVYVMKEFKAVSKTPEFLYLTKEQLLALLSSDDLSASEEAVYEAVMTWINHDIRKRKKEMRELMELVRFPFMDKLYFMENVESNEAMRKSCQDVMTEARKYQMFPGEVQSPRTRPRHASGLREAVVIIGGKTRGASHIAYSSDFVTMTCSAEPSTSSWIPLTSRVNQQVIYSYSAVVLGTSDIVLTGRSGKDVWLYQPVLNSWSTFAPKNLDQYYHQLAVLQGKVYAIGGNGGNASVKRALTTVEVYDRSQHKWTEGVALPQPRFSHAVAVVNGSMYVIGGFDDGGNSTSTVFSFTPGDSHWQPQKDMPVASGDITASVLNGKVYVPVPSKVLCFEPGENGGSWSVAANTGVGACCGMTVFRGKVYMYGGIDKNAKGATTSSAVFCLNPEAKSLNRVGDMAGALFAHGCVTILKTQ